MAVFWAYFSNMTAEALRIITEEERFFRHKPNEYTSSEDAHDPADGQNSYPSTGCGDIPQICAPGSTHSALPNNKGKGKKTHDDSDGDDERRDESKNPSRLLSPPSDKSDNMKFACPYRKRQPQKYRSSNRPWRSCALMPLDNVARANYVVTSANSAKYRSSTYILRGHLYRHHMIYPCPRCKDIFENQEAVKIHLNNVQVCNVKEIKNGDGVTVEDAEKIRSKKRRHRGETESDRWQNIYALLFPSALATSPCRVPASRKPALIFHTTNRPANKFSLDFEPPSDESELEEYDEYCRRELPQEVRAAVERFLSFDPESTIPNLMVHLDDFIRSSQERVFANYRNPVDVSGIGDPVSTGARTSATHSPQYGYHVVSNDNIPSGTTKKSNDSNMSEVLSFLGTGHATNYLGLDESSCVPRDYNSGRGNHGTPDSR